MHVKTQKINRGVCESCRTLEKRIEYPSDTREGLEKGKIQARALKMGYSAPQSKGQGSSKGVRNMS